MSIDHMGLSVVDMAKMKDFYVKVVATLDLKVGYEAPNGGAVGLGDGTSFPCLFLMKSDTQQRPRAHFAFRAKNRAAVNAFYKVAMELGAKDNGPPGIREHYHSNYYSCFVIDPEGHNIEAVTHAAE